MRAAGKALRSTESSTRSRCCLSPKTICDVRTAFPFAALRTKSDLLISSSLHVFQRRERPRNGPDQFSNSKFAVENIAREELPPFTRAFCAANLIIPELAEFGRNSRRHCASRTKGLRTIRNAPDYLTEPHESKEESGFVVPRNAIRGPRTTLHRDSISNDSMRARRTMTIELGTELRRVQQPVTFGWRFKLRSTGELSRCLLSASTKRNSNIFKPCWDRIAARSRSRLTCSPMR